MTHVCKVVFIFALMFSALTHAFAVTMEELSKYLGVTAWTTKVGLPASSFIIEVWTIKDGKPDQRLIEGMPAWNKKPEKGVTILIGTENGKYRVVVAYGGGVTMTSSRQISTFKSVLSGELPKTIKEGDFPLLGQPNVFGNHDPNEVSTFTTGFLLRVKKL